jgi:hypothetical protein
MERYEQLRTAATLGDVTVLLHGESGAGDLAAADVHALSRRSGNFVDIYCAALSKDIVEGELGRWKDWVLALLAEPGLPWAYEAWMGVTAALAFVAVHGLHAWWVRPG